MPRPKGSKNKPKTKPRKSVPPLDLMKLPWDILEYYQDKAEREFRTLEQQLLYELTFNCNSECAENRARHAGQIL